MRDATCLGQCLYKGDTKHDGCASSCCLQELQKPEESRVEERKCGRRWLEEQAVQSQGEDRGPTACRGWESALGTEVTCWEPAEKFPEFAVMEIVYTRSMGEEEGVSQIYRSVRDGKKCLGKQKG